MKIAIIDDEVHCIETLVILLNRLFPECAIVYKSNKISEAAERLPDLQIDLLFLDIEMPGMNGFQLLEQIPQRRFDVIFTTAYSQYALRAFKAKAINYLLKPVDEQELKEAVETWRRDKQQQGRLLGGNIDQLLEHLKKEGFVKSKISVPVSDGYEFIEVNNIMYCKSESNYTTLHLEEDRRLMISKTLKEVERSLSPFAFIRVHQSYLINPNFLKTFSRSDGGYLVMQDKAIIPVSHSRRGELVGIFETIRKKDS